mmetsp:Transcript_16058/g.29014  ORF Transcript_16058/g.29014 Transcript_16058/m.29014 type:complete len:225 (-) Transcript_16058:303-977(-)
MKLVTVDGVTQIIKLSIGDKQNVLVLFFFFSKEFKQRLGYFQVGNFIASTNVVDMSWRTLVENDIKGIGHVRHVQKVTSVTAITMNGKRQITHELIGQFGNELFGILVRSIDIVSSCNENGQLEGAKVRLDQKLGTRLCRRVWIGRFQDVLFQHGVGIEIFSFTIDFIRTDVNESLNGRTALCGFEENVSTVNVGMSKGKGVSKGVVDMCLSSKVHDGVNIFLL